MFGKLIKIFVCNVMKQFWEKPLSEKWQLAKVKYTSWVKKYKDFLLSNTIASPFFLPDSGVGLLGKQVFWSIKHIFHRKEQNKKRDGFIDYEVKMMSFPIILCTFSLFKVGRFYWKLIQGIRNFRFSSTKNLFWFYQGFLGIV